MLIHFRNEPENARVAHPPLDHLHELASHDRIKVAGNICFQDVCDPASAYHPAYLIQCVMLTTFRAESVGAFEEILLIDCIEQRHRGLLHDLVLQGGNGDRSLLSSFLRDIDPPQGLCTIPLALDAFLELPDIPLGILPIFRIRNVVHSSAGVLPQTLECLLQGCWRE